MVPASNPRRPYSATEPEVLGPIADPSDDAVPGRDPFSRAHANAHTDREADATSIGAVRDLGGWHGYAATVPVRRGARGDAAAPAPRDPYLHVQRPDGPVREGRRHVPHPLPRRAGSA